jgi:hypothetical protein
MINLLTHLSQEDHVNLEHFTADDVGSNIPHDKRFEKFGINSKTHEAGNSKIPQERSDILSLLE